MEAYPIGLCESQRMVVVQVWGELPEHPPKDASHVWFGRHTYRSDCRLPAERTPNEVGGAVYSYGFYKWLFCCTLYGLELQLPHPDGANPLAGSLRDDASNASYPLLLCPAGRDLLCTTANTSTKFCIKPLPDSWHRERLSAENVDEEQEYAQET